MASSATGYPHSDGMTASTSATWNEDTLARRRRVLGDDHPDTLFLAGLDLILRGLATAGEPG